MSEYPTGTVTFLFTDIEGSTKLSQQYPEFMPALLARHNEILNQAIESHNGFVFQVVGDSYAVAFHNANDALNAAIQAQRNLHNENWNPAPIKVRMGIHTGAAQLQIDSKDTPYSGYAALALTQRIMSAGHGGQILISSATANLLRGQLPKDATLRDMGEKNLKDIFLPERIYQLNVPDLPSEFAPLNTYEKIRHNLPLQLTTFIGREKEVEQIKKRLEKNHLVTLTGSGGIGKTRLSIQVASELLNDYPIGVWLVELAPLTDPALVPQSVCAALGVTPEGNTSALDALIDYLRAKKILLVVDNCEHLIDACAQLCDSLLHACPDLLIIASSREALGIEGENAYRVPSLSLPDPKSGLHVIEESEAVMLFMERATTILPEFEMIETNAPAIAQICQRLDGIALAIELAASRVKMLKVEQIATRLDDAFRLLTGGSRTALPRQQTLRALIDWSYNLLSDEERTFLRKLSVFMGGWTLEAAEAICGNADALDLLTHLVDKSLVSVDLKHGDEPRYYLLETVRQYAREKLVESNEISSMRQQHLAFFLQFAEKDEPGVYSDKMNQWFDELHIELDNLRIALDWSFTYNTKTGLRLIGILGRFFFGFPNYAREGLNWLQKFLTLPETSSHTFERAKALRWAGAIQRPISWQEQANSQPLFQQGQLWLEESRTIYQELGYQPGVADALYELGRYMENTNDRVTAHELLTASIQISQEAGDKLRTARGMNILGDVFMLQGDSTQARRLYEEALSIYRGLKHRQAPLWPLGNLGALALANGDLISARSYLEESLTLYREADNEIMATWVLCNLGEVAIRQERFDEARAYIERSIAFTEEASSNLGLEFLALAFLNYSQGDYHQADHYYRQSLLMTKHTIAFGFAEPVEGLAKTAAMQGKAIRAITLFGVAAAIREATRTPLLPIYKADNEHANAAAHIQLSEDEFNKAWVEGKAMSTEEAIQFAMEETP
jgi:predicted ATPase/class 3 adenylate cyclase/tetratricopeptide (TPR) repeat protein